MAKYEKIEFPRRIVNNETQKTIDVFPVEGVKITAYLAVAKSQTEGQWCVDFIPTGDSVTRTKLKKQAIAAAEEFAKIPDTFWEGMLAAYRKSEAIDGEYDREAGYKYAKAAWPWGATAGVLSRAYRNDVLLTLEEAKARALRERLAGWVAKWNYYCRRAARGIPTDD